MSGSSVELLAEAQTLLTRMVEYRRAIHRQPELGLDLPRTQALIAEALEQLGLHPQLGAGLSSVCATVGGELGRGPATLLRADMDALPLTERTGLEFASEINGAMHACGHDVHVAMLLGAAQLLSARVEQLPRPVLLMFQPGEEAYFGARLMIEEGLIEQIDPPASRSFALHVNTRSPCGEVHLRPGPILASASRFRITVNGRGGHASAPHRAVDPIPVAAQVATALQTAVTRELNATDPVVLTVGSFHAGTNYNVIAHSAELEGTFRAVSLEGREAVGAMIERVASGLARAHQAEASVEIEGLYPPTVNDELQTEAVRRCASELLGPDAVRTMQAPDMGAEDFSYVLEKVPGTYALLGARPDGLMQIDCPDLHSDRVIFNEDAMATGAALHAAVALA
jgi:amidohydrolase